MDAGVALRAAAGQALAVAAVALVLDAALDRSFFESWGWLAGPAAWAGCALLVGRMLGLPWAPVLIGAALAGLPSVLAVAVGVHWLGAVLGVPLFGLWSGRLARERALPARAV